MECTNVSVSHEDILAAIDQIRQKANNEQTFKVKQKSLNWKKREKLSSQSLIELIHFTLLRKKVLSIKQTRNSNAIYSGNNCNKNSYDNTDLLLRTDKNVSNNNNDGSIFHTQIYQFFIVYQLMTIITFPIPTLRLIVKMTSVLSLLEIFQAVSRNFRRTEKYKRGTSFHIHGKHKKKGNGNQKSLSTPKDGTPVSEKYDNQMNGRKVPPALQETPY